MNLCILFYNNYTDLTPSAPTFLIQWNSRTKVAAECEYYVISSDEEDTLPRKKTKPLCTKSMNNGSKTRRRDLIMNKNADDTFHKKKICCK